MEIIRLGKNKCAVCGESDARYELRFNDGTNVKICEGGLVALKHNIKKLEGN